MSIRREMLEYLESGGKVSGVTALAMFRCMDASSAIRDLRAKGHKIQTDLRYNEQTKKQYAVYSMRVN